MKPVCLLGLILVLFILRKMMLPSYLFSTEIILAFDLIVCVQGVGKSCVSSVMKRNLALLSLATVDST